MLFLSFLIVSVFFYHNVYAAGQELVSYQCAMCPECFKNDHALNQHRIQANHTPDCDLNRLKCYYCGMRTCGTIRELFEHMRNNKKCLEEQNRRMNQPTGLARNEFVPVFNDGDESIVYGYNLCENCGRACVKSKTKHINCNPGC